VKQYQVLVDPDRMRYYGFTIRGRHQALVVNNANSGGGVLPPAPSST
jgi:heavy metal efflux system protein